MGGRVVHRTPPVHGVAGIGPDLEDEHARRIEDARDRQLIFGGWLDAGDRRHVQFTSRSPYLSAIAFRLARPVSKSPPTILSMSMNTWMILAKNGVRPSI